MTLLPVTGPFRFWADQACYRADPSGRRGGLRHPHHAARSGEIGSIIVTHRPSFYSDPDLPRDERPEPRVVASPCRRDPPR